jgi:hypothetical protein
MLHIGDKLLQNLDNNPNAYLRKSGQKFGFRLFVLPLALLRTIFICPAACAI